MDSSYVLAYEEVADVPFNVITTIVSRQYDQSCYLTKVMCSGTIFAEYTMQIDNKTVLTRRSGPSRNTDFSLEYFPLFLEKKKEIRVSVKHYRQSMSEQFECTIFGFN